MYGTTSNATGGILETSVDGNDPDYTVLDTATPTCGPYLEIIVPNGDHTATLTLLAASGEVLQKLTLIGSMYVP